MELNLALVYSVNRPQLRIQKMGHVNLTMPLLGVICHPYD